MQTHQDKPPSAEALAIQSALDLYMRALGTPLESQRYAEFRQTVERVKAGAK